MSLSFLSSMDSAVAAVAVAAAEAVDEVSAFAFALVLASTVAGLDSTKEASEKTTMASKTSSHCIELSFPQFSRRY